MSWGPGGLLLAGPRRKKRGCGFARNKPPGPHASCGPGAKRGDCGQEDERKARFSARCQLWADTSGTHVCHRANPQPRCARRGPARRRRWPAIPSVGLPTLSSARCQLWARYSRGPRLSSSESAAAVFAARTSEMTDVGPVRDVSCPSCLDAFHLPQHGVVPLLAGVAVDVGGVHGELAAVHVAEVLDMGPDGLFPA